MRLSIEKRARIVHLYLKHDLAFVKNRFGELRKLALKKDINTSEKTIAKKVKHWLKNGS